MEDLAFALILINRRRRNPVTYVQRDLQSTNVLFTVSDTVFKGLYRLTKNVAWELVESLRPFLLVQKKITDLPPETRVLIALRFFAQGSYQLAVGRDKDLLVCQKTVSNCLKQVTHLIVEKLSHAWIKFPTGNELLQIRTKFFQKHGFPGVIGCIDGTHVSIIAPHINEHIYINRKGYHSLNVQLICDSDHVIRNVNAKFPGSTHDSFIWKNSLARAHLNDKWVQNQLGSCWLLGDSGYPLEPYLLTPFNERTTQNHEQHFNLKFKNTRITIEQVNGQLKSRFRCLLKHRVLNYSAEMAGSITVACCILHNMCKAANLQDVENEVEEEEEELENTSTHTSQTHEGRRMRDRVARQMFTAFN